MPSARHFSPLFVLALCAAGCSKDAVNPLDCAFADYVDRVSVAAGPAAKVDFHADWGTAPSSMALRLFRGDHSRVYVQGCGRDQDHQEWELQATWSQLQAGGATETEAIFFDQARLDAGERLAEGEPDFAGSLLRCQPDPVGCVAVDRIAFVYQYSVSFSQNVSGVARLHNLDFDLGRLSADILADPGEPSDEPATHVEFAVTWDPHLLSELSSAEGGAGGESAGGGGAGPG